MTLSSLEIGYRAGMRRVQWSGWVGQAYYSSEVLTGCYATVGIVNQCPQGMTAERWFAIVRCAHYLAKSDPQKVGWAWYRIYIWKLKRNILDAIDFLCNTAGVDKPFKPLGVRAIIQRVIYRG